MDKYIKPCIVAVGSGAAMFLGGWDVLLQTLVTLIILDIVTGILAAWIMGEASSDVMNDKIPRKIMMMVMVTFAVCIDRFLGLGDAMRIIMCVSYIVKEATSIIENSANAGLPVPEAVTSRLAQVNTGTIDTLIKGFTNKEETDAND